VVSGRVHALLASAVVVIGVAAFASAGCNDPVHDQQVAALGPEAPGVSPGPTHRPGQPCLVCHGGQGPASLQFSIGGTVFLRPDQTSQPAVSAQVELEDALGNYWHTTTNTAGNFYVLQSNWSPTYPLQVPIVADSTGMTSQVMGSLDNRDGSCASCHQPAEGPNSAGPVYLYMADGG
jgi:hypothetical protein